jgi:hypothetical protein
MARDELHRGSRPEGCLYCGRAWKSGVVNKSAEHPLGEWMKRQEQNHPQEQRVIRFGVEFDESTNDFVNVGSPDPRTRKKPLLNLRTRDVCEDCNTGPLKAAQDAAKPIILQLDSVAESGLALVMSRQQAIDLTVWAQMAALTYELTSGFIAVGNVEMGRQLSRHEPLPYSQVWLCRHPRDYDLSIALAQVDVSATEVARPDPPDRRALLVAVVYHHFSVLVFIANSPGQSWPRMPFEKWTLFWPLLGLRQPEFPPLRTVSGTELTEIFTHPGRWIPPVRGPGAGQAA